MKLSIAPEVANALEANAPVVALESTVIAHGQSGHGVTIQSSADFAVWSPVQSGTLDGNGAFQISVSTAPTARSYRAVDNTLGCPSTFSNEGKLQV